MKKCISLLLVLSLLISLTSLAAAEQALDTRPRTVVTTDLECDDIDSLLHLLLYANDIDIAGIVISASTHHWTGDGEHTLAEVVSSYQKNGELTEWRPMEVDWVTNTLVNEYAAVYSSLIQHDPRYPTPGELVERTKIGNILFEGDMREATEGSDHIMSLLLDDDMRTLYMQAWGGANTIARALKSIEEAYKGTDEWQAIYEKVCQKSVLISFGDQDNTYADYISVNWPDLGRLYCVSSGIGYNISYSAPVPYQSYFKPEWMMENIKFGHGKLMGKYLLFGDGTYYEGELPQNQYGFMDTLNTNPGCIIYRFHGPFYFDRYEFISEGDSPCWMYLIPVGLRGLEKGAYGSWGGRLGDDGKAMDEFDPSLGKMTSGYSLHRWFPAFMNDWAARADWCVTSYEEANHQPVVVSETLDFEVAPGTTVELVGSASDPDGDSLSVDWWIYKDACVYSGASLAYLDVWTHDVAATAFTVPKDAADGDYFNIVFEVTDDGVPALTRYAQAIVKVAAPAETTK